VAVLNHGRALIVTDRSAAIQASYNTMNIKEQIRQFVAENFLFSNNGFNLADDASFLDTGVIDSTGTLELVMFVEEAFNIEIEDDEIEPDNLDSVNSLFNFIQRKTQ